MNTKKIYVLDTNVPIQSPYALFAFQDNDVVLVDVTLEELDNLKTRPGEVGMNARETNRILEELRLSGDLLNGVPLPNGGSIRVETDHLNTEVPEHWEKNKPDNQIIRATKGIMEDAEDGTQVILVSQDIAVRLKATLVGLKAEEYKADSIQENNYTGRRDAYVSQDTMSLLYSNKEISNDLVFEEDGITQITPSIHEFFILHNLSDPQSTIMVRYNGNTYKKIYDWKGSGLYGIIPRNSGQSFAMEALMLSVEEAPLVILKGPAGTAKTFLSLAAALEEVVNSREDSNYDKILISRPNIKFDETLGFLKGGEQEKIAPLMRPIIDNLEKLTKNKTKARNYDDDYSWKTKKQHKKAKGVYNNSDETDDSKYEAYNANSYVEELFEQGLIKMESLEYMRGRSIDNTIIIIDEAQNMSPTQAYGIISRAGDNTKIILAGDVNQVDNPRLDTRSNGLAYASYCMKGKEECVQVTFSESECTRSKLAKAAVKYMTPTGKHVK